MYYDLVQCSKPYFVVCSIYEFFQSQFIFHVTTNNSSEIDPLLHVTSPLRGSNLPRNILTMHLVNCVIN